VSGLDDLDRRLLDLLAQDARMPLTGLAKRLGVARSTAQVRLARLEAQGVIGGYTLRPGPSMPATDGLAAMVSLVVDSRLADRVVGCLGRLAEVRRVHAVAGSVDLLVWVRTATPASLDALLDTIGAIPGVARTTSSVVLATPIDRDPVPTLPGD
jgi:DNA-binding Lrp family transcriptional regulator